jgi:alcohol dehydrogenase class IV
MAAESDTLHPHRFCNPVKITSGIKALEHLPVELGHHGAVRPMVLTHREHGFRRRLRRLVKAFRDSGMTLVVYDRLPQETDPGEIHTLAGHFRDAGCDAILALGGGGLLHQAKALRLLAEKAISETDALEGESFSKAVSPSMDGGSQEVGAIPAGPSELPDPDDLTGDTVPLFWLPTGPGAGDELGGDLHIAGRSLRHPRLRPQMACIDKRLLDLGDRCQVLNNVLVALVNAVEVCLTRGDNPFAATYAEAAIKTIAETLTPEGLGARRADIHLALTNAAVWADCARDMAPVGRAHRLGRALSEQLDTDVGICMALCLPAVVDDALAKEARLAAELLHLLGDADLYSLTLPKLRRARCVNLLREGWHALCENWPDEIPAGLAETGIDEAGLEAVARRANPSDPRTGLRILRESWALIAPHRLQALPSDDGGHPAPMDPNAERGAQDAPAELL